MKLVIDMPEEDYQAIKNMSVVGDMTIPYVFNSIRKGTPLPKGHGDLIDVSEYFKKEFGDAREFLDKATIIIEADDEERSEK